MKKKTLVLLITVLLISLSGCGNRNTTEKEKNNEESKQKIENIFKKDDENVKTEEKKDNKVDIEYKKTLLENELLEIGKYFYEDYYYQSIIIYGKKPQSFLADFKDIGIKINLLNLANLSKYKEKIDKDFKNCDSKETKVTIYPKDPYGSGDYEIEVSLSCSFEDENKVDKDFQKTLLENELLEIGKYFYEDYYYKNITNPKTFVAGFKDVGIKIDLLNLANLPKYKEKIDKDFKNCDSKETKVTIFPKAPYGVTNYDITINLSCSFDE